MSAGKQENYDLPVVPDSAPHVRLAVQSGHETGTSIACRRIVTLIGSRPGCKVVLKHRSVAPAHVAVVNDGTHVRVVDLVTPTGTKLNGLKMEHEVVSDGDMLAISGWKFRIELQRGAGVGEHDDHAVGLDPTPEVVALEHTSTGRLLQPNREICIIGRRKGCDIAISDPRVSRVHALLITYQGHPAIVDLDSTRGTLVNDEPIAFRMLNDGDEVKVGESCFRARILGSAVGDPDSNGSSPEKTPAPIVLESPPNDEIDIAHVEGSQRWRIADSMEKASKKV